MHKKQKITTALTVNFNKSFNRDYCEKIMRIVFSKANRKLFGRRHKYITAIGNFELTKVGNIHVHFAVACPARYMSRFVKITNEVLEQIANSSSIYFSVLNNSNNVRKWFGYIDTKNSLQVNSSTTV